MTSDLVAFEDAIDDFLGELLLAGVDGAVARIEVDGRPTLTHAAGSDADGTPVAVSSWFDLASVTKAFVGTLAVVLAKRGELSLGHRVGEVLEGVPKWLTDVPLEDLLRHRSGLRPWLPLYEGGDAEARILDCLFRESSGGGEIPCYSDLGFILWGLIAEKALAKPLFQLLLEHVLEPLGSEGLVAATPGPLPQVLACRLDNGVEVRLAKELGVEVGSETVTRRGVAQDGNARFLTGSGEVVGHCGLFGSAEGIASLARGWTTEVLLPDKWRQQALASCDRYAIGWWRYLDSSPDRDRSVGVHFGPSSFGMIGFTGSSCWVDPDRGLVAVLAAHRGRSDLDMGPWRRRFHQLAISFCDSQG